MEFINKIFIFIINILERILPVFEPSPKFVKMLDDGISFFITMIENVSWFVPLEILVACLTVIFLVDNFALIWRIVDRIVSLIRG